MKFVASLFCLITSVAAFAPAPQAPGSTVLRLSDEPAEAECWPVTPFGIPNFFLGKGVWDSLTTEYGSAATGTFLKAAELKHGRAAMLATVGYSFHKLGLTLDSISVHEYLSVTQGITFADLQAMKPVDAIFSVPVEGLAQMFAVIGAIEIYELTHKDGEIATGESVAPGLRPGGLTGDIGWNPLQFPVTERRQLVEIQNGRAAMFAISAWIAADTLPGSMPLPLPW